MLKCNNNSDNEYGKQQSFFSLIIFFPQINIEKEQ